MVYLRYNFKVHVKWILDNEHVTPTFGICSTFFTVRRMSALDLKNLKKELQTEPYIKRTDAATLIQKTLDQKGINLDLEPTLQTSLYTSPISVPKVSTYIFVY